MARCLSKPGPGVWQVQLHLPALHRLGKLEPGRKLLLSIPAIIAPSLMAKLLCLVLWTPVNVIGHLPAHATGSTTVAPMDEAVMAEPDGNGVSPSTEVAPSFLSSMGRQALGGGLT